MTDPSPHLLAETLKDVATRHDLTSLKGTVRYGSVWVAVEVRHAALMSESMDGWDVEITTGEDDG